MTTPNTPDASGPSSSPSPAKKGKRRWVKWTLIGGGVVVVGGALLVLLTPSLLSTGLGKSIVLGQVNSRINGKVEIESWSLGWFSPISVTGIKVYDDQNRLALTVGKVTTGVTIAHAARGNLSLGDIVIDSPNLVLVELNKDGTSNFSKMLKVAAGAPPSAAAPAGPTAAAPSASGPVTLPEVTGTVTIKNLTGAIQGTLVGPSPVRIESSDIAIKIPSLQNQPISDDVKLTVRRDGFAPGTITVAGSVQAVTGGVLDINKLKAAQKVTLSGIDLSAANAFLGSAGLELTVGGTADGAIDAKVDGLSAASVTGEIKVAKLSAGGGLMKGDTFASDLFTIPLSITTTKSADGSPQVHVESLGVHSAELTADVKADVSQTMATNLAAMKGPGGAGSVDVSLGVPDLSKLAKQLPHVLSLNKDLVLKSGAVSVTGHVALESSSVGVTGALKVEDVAGTNAGQSISLVPIGANLDATATFGDKGLGTVALKGASLTSAFANATASGDQADLSFSADVSLDKAKSQIAPFVDLKGIDFGGSLKASGTLKGDGLAHAPVAVVVNVEQSNLRVSGVGSLGTINVDRLVAGVTSSVTLAADDKVTAKDSKITLEVGAAGSPVVKANVTVAGVDVASQSVTKFDVAADVTDLKEVQQRFGGLVKVLSDDHLAFQGGSIHVTAAGDVKNAKPVLSAPAVVTVKGLTLYRDTMPLLVNEDLTVQAEASSPDDFKTIAASVDVTGKLVSASLKGVTVNAADPSDIWNLATVRQITVKADDLAKLQGIATAFAPNATPWRVESGGLAVDLSVGRKGTVTTLAVSSLKLRGLTARNGMTSVVTLKNDVDLKLAVDVDAATANGKDVLHQIKSATVTALDGSLSVATIKLDAPLVVTDLTAAVPSAKGGVTITGNLGDITPIVEALQGTPGSLSGYAGSFVVTQKLATDANGTSASGTVAANITLKDSTGKTLFADPKIAVGNDLAINPTSMDATIRKLTVTTSSGALNVTVTGAVKDLLKTRTISEPLRVALQYDLAKLMPLVQPVLPPSATTALAGSTITGQFSRDYVVTGSFPAGVPFEKSIQSLAATGGFALGHVALPAYGATLDNFDETFKLEQGVVALSMAKPAGLNGGQLNLSGIKVNLTESVPHADIAAGTTLVQGIALNKVLADKMGTFFGPIFVNTDQASGLVTVKVDKCTHFPLSALAMQNVAANDGDLEVSLDITNLELVGGFAGSFVRQIPAIGNYFVGNVNGAKFIIKNGIVDHTLPITVGTGVTGNLSFTGKIELFGDQKLNPMQVRIGSNLLKDKIPFVRDIIQVADPVIVIKGTLAHPQLDLAAGIGQWIKDQGKGLLPGILGGGVPGATSQPAQKNNPVGGILDALGGLGKKKK